MIDPQTIGLLLVGLFLVACGASAGFTFWLTCRLYDERVARRDEQIKTLKAALAQEVNTLKAKLFDMQEELTKLSSAQRAPNPQQPLNPPPAP